MNDKKVLTKLSWSQQGGMGSLEEHIGEDVRGVDSANEIKRLPYSVETLQHSKV